MVEMEVKRRVGYPPGEVKVTGEGDRKKDMKIGWGKSRNVNGKQAGGTPGNTYNNKSNKSTLGRCCEKRQKGLGKIGSENKGILQRGGEDRGAR